MNININNLTAYGTCSVATDCDTQYGFSDWKVNVYISFSESGEVKTHFRVYEKAFDDYHNALFSCNSYNELKLWVEEHRDEIK